MFSDIKLTCGLPAAGARLRRTYVFASSYSSKALVQSVRFTHGEAAARDASYSSEALIQSIRFARARAQMLDEAAALATSYSSEAPVQLVRFARGGASLPAKLKLAYQSNTLFSWTVTFNAAG